MFCNKCGTEIFPPPSACPRCGSCSVTSGFNSQLVGAILVTLFCCQIFGIVAIVYAAMANAKHSSGDVLGAFAMAEKAKTWMFWGFFTGLVVQLIMLVGFMAQAM